MKPQLTAPCFAVKLEVAIGLTIGILLVISVSAILLFKTRSMTYVNLCRHPTHHENNKEGGDPMKNSVNLHDIPATTTDVRHEPKQTGC